MVVKKGHGTLIREMLKGDWWIVFHSLMKRDFIISGRRTLLEPIEWKKRWMVPNYRENISDSQPIKIRN